MNLYIESMQGEVYIGKNTVCFRKIFIWFLKNKAKMKSPTIIE